MNRRYLGKVISVIVFVCFITTIGSAEIYVSSSADSGPGTFREAVGISNTTTGIQTIDVRVTSPIAITSTIAIQAPIIVHGNHNTITSDRYMVLHLENSSNGSVIQNLVITNTYTYGDRFGIGIESENNTITGCVIGTDWSGASNLSHSHGIYLYYANDNYIGGDQTVGNVISGNTSYGIYMFNSHRNVIAGNTIGLTPDKGSPRPNNTGIYLEYSDNNYIGIAESNHHNIISGNQQYGLHIDTGSNGNVVENNMIGISDDNSTFSEQNDGICLESDANFIGSADSNGHNIISGNTRYEIYSYDADNNIITGNYIGSTISGDQTISGFANIKIYFSSYCTENIIGTKESGLGNKIFGGDYGIRCDSYGSQRNRWYANLIKDVHTQPIVSATYSSPVITYAHTNFIWGTALANDYIEVFKAGPDGGSESFLGYSTADSQGDWSLAITGVTENDSVVALASDDAEQYSTSEFSSAVVVNNSSGPPTPTFTPTLTATPDYGINQGEFKVFNNIIRRNRSSQCIVRWQQPQDSATTIRVLDENGKLVRKLVSERWYTTGQTHHITWDATNTSDVAVASGLYYVHIKSKGMNQFSKILVMDR